MRRLSCRDGELALGPVDLKQRTSTRRIARGGPRGAFRRLAATFICTILAGCGGPSYELTPVSGRVTLDGQPVPDAHVSLAGEPVKIRPDGSFTVRLSMPDRRQVLPVVASSADGVEQRTIVLAVERNTKFMEPMIREANE